MVTGLNSAAYLDALSYIHCEQKEFWRRDRKYSQKKLLNDIRPNKDKTWQEPSPATITRALQGIGNGSWLTKRLENPEVRKRVEKSLGVDNILSFSEEQIDRAIRNKRRSNGKTSQKELISDSSNSNDLAQENGFQGLQIVTHGQHNPVAPVERAERGALRALAQELLNSPNPIVHWAAEPWSGASVIAYSLAHHKEIKAQTSQLVMIRSWSTNRPYERELWDLARNLGITPSRIELPSHLAEIIYERKLLVVVCDACFIPNKEYAENNLMRRFLKAVVERGSKHEFARVLTIGRSEAMASITKRVPEPGRALSFSHDLNQQMQLQPGDRFEMYRSHFTRYRTLRGMTNTELGGSRLKRGYWHYEATQDKVVMPGNVRLRAYFASNSENFGYFDSTAGFEALCGADTSLPIDIRLIQMDITSYLRLKSVGSNVPEIRSLRLVSTSKHWLTKSAFNELRLRKGLETRSGSKCDVAPAELTFGAFQARIDDPYCPLNSAVRRGEPDLKGRTDDEEVYTIGLGVRAIVQDEWRQNARDERALAHWRVSRLLYDLRHDKEMLRREFPYRRHYGRSRIYFLGNTLTHLMRTIENVPMPDTPCTQPSADDGFPDPPREALGGCDPRQILEFCYLTLYQRGLNGNLHLNKQNGRPSRALAKRHGAFEYAAEMLQLMSHNRQIGTPHPALPKHLHNDFIRECGFALLDVGELKKAQFCFESILSQENVPLHVSIDERLNLALVLTERMQLKRAENEIRTSKALIENASVDQLTLKQAEACQRRVCSRQAQICYLKKDYKGALRKIRNIEQKEALRGLTVSDSALLHLKVATLSQWPEYRDDALAEATIAAMRNSTDGHQHEAIGFRVAVAHSFRRSGRPDLGERFLDDIMSDLLKNGSSERTLLSTSMEAGRTLIALGEPVKLLRGYASYIRPCVGRAHEKGFRRYALNGSKHAIAVLKQLKEMIHNNRDEEWSELVDNAVKEESRYVQRDRPKSDHFFEVDPLFGYFLDESSEVISSLSSSEGIAKELEYMENIFKENTYAISF